MLGLPLLHRLPSLISPPTLLPKLTPKAFYFHNRCIHFASLPQVLPLNVSGFSRRLLATNISVFSSDDDDFDVDLDRLLALLPDEMRRRVSEHPELHQLIEVVMDLGRKPLARFPSGDFVISDHPITVQDIDRATSQVGDFAVDNRAGISRTLHRISAIRNRKGAIIGLTCRVGRAISGSAKLLRDLVQRVQHVSTLFFCNIN